MTQHFDEAVLQSCLRGPSVRRATPSDAVALAIFFQDVCDPAVVEAPRWTHAQLRSALMACGEGPSEVSSNNSANAANGHSTSSFDVWIAVQDEGHGSTPSPVSTPEAIVGVLVLEHDHAHGIGRVSEVRIRRSGGTNAQSHAVPDTAMGKDRFLALLAAACATTRAEGKADVLYFTTRAAPRICLEWSRALGFEAVGRFPGARTRDGSGANPIMYWWANATPGTLRRAPVALHPAAAALGGLVLPIFGLTAPPIASNERSGEPIEDPVPELEIVRAPLFVRHRFATVKEKRFLAASFYPFHEPNALICDPELRCEVFLHISGGFGTLIGEHIQRTVPYSGLLLRVAEILEGQGVRFVQAMGLAADTIGLDAFLGAGFLPCAYLPAFQRQGKSRVDCVLMCLSFERERALPERVDEDLQAIVRVMDQTRAWWGL